MILTIETENKTIIRTAPRKVVRYSFLSNTQHDDVDRSYMFTPITVVKRTAGLLYYIEKGSDNIGCLSLEEYNDGKWEIWLGDELQPKNKPASGHQEIKEGIEKYV